MENVARKTNSVDQNARESGHGTSRFATCSPGSGSGSRAASPEEVGRRKEDEVRGDSVTPTEGEVDTTGYPKKIGHGTSTTAGADCVMTTRTAVASLPYGGTRKNPPCDIGASAATGSIRNSRSSSGVGVLRNLVAEHDRRVGMSAHSGTDDNGTKETGDETSDSRSRLNSVASGPLEMRKNQAAVPRISSTATGSTRKLPQSSSGVSVLRNLVAAHDRRINAGKEGSISISTTIETQHKNPENDACGPIQASPEKNAGQETGDGNVHSDTMSRNATDRSSQAAPMPMGPDAFVAVPVEESRKNFRFALRHTCAGVSEDGTVYCNCNHWT